MMTPAGDAMTTTPPLPLAPGERYRLLQGDAGGVLDAFPSECVHMAMTSPPYWAVRRYSAGDGLGNEKDPDEYVSNLVRILARLERVLRPDGSLWLNVGDTYQGKSLVGIPWRVALALQARGWIVRNAVVWDKVKGNPCNARDKLRDMYELVFHLARSPSIHYDGDAIREPPGRPTIRKDGTVVTPTGVSGIKYRRQIEESALSPAEKRNALAALQEALGKVRDGLMPDFRMIVRGVQRATHGDDADYSGRASELEQRGFCVLPYHAKGSKPGDVWRIVPEDEWRKDAHAAVYPVELCRIPILATCPPGGIVLDPFVGTGTTVAAAVRLGRRAVGIDVSEEYLAVARERLRGPAVRAAPATRG